MNRKLERPSADVGLRLQLSQPAARAWLDQHLYSALSSLGRLWARRGASTLTVLVMGLALALPLMLSVAVNNLQRFGGNLTDSREITAFLQVDLDGAGAQRARKQVLALADVGSVTVRDPAAGLDELRALEGFGPALELIGENPLPHVLVVAPTAQAGSSGVETLARAIESLDAVDFVKYDLAWRQRLDALLSLAQRVVWVAGILLALGALLVVGNTIRLDVAARAEEIAIVQLLGGTDGFVRRPFLYAGCWYGLLAALVSLAGTWIAYFALAGPVARLAQTYAAEHTLRGPGSFDTFAMLAAGIVLGWLGAWAATGRQLAQGKPQ